VLQKFQPGDSLASSSFVHLFQRPYGRRQLFRFSVLLMCLFAELNEDAGKPFPLRAAQLVLLVVQLYTKLVIIDFLQNLSTKSR
jgi:hypothetical protein